MSQLEINHSAAVPAHQLSGVLEASDAILRCSLSGNRQQALDTAANRIHDILSAESCAILLASSPSRDILEVASSFTDTSGAVRPPSKPIAVKSERGGGLTAHIAYHSVSANLSFKEIQKSAYWGRTRPTYLASAECYSLLAVPIKDLNGRLVGLLKAENKKDASGRSSPDIWFTAADEVVASLLAHKLALLLDHLNDQSSRRHKEPMTLREAQEPYHRLIEDLGLRVAQKNREGRIIYANKAFCDSLGLSENEIVGKTDATLFPPALAAKYLEDDKKILDGSEPFLDITEDFVFPFSPNSAPVAVRVLKTPVRDLNGEIMAVQVTFWDLAQSEITALLNETPDCIYFKDSKSRFTRVSRSMVRLFRRTSDKEIIGKTDLDFFAPNNARAKFEDERQLLQGTVPMISKEEAEISLDGKHHAWVSTIKLPLRIVPTGPIIGTFGISRNVTADRIRREMLWANELRYRGLFEHARDMIYTHDLSGTFTSLNKAGEELLGWSNAEFRKKKIDDVVSPDDCERVLKLLREKGPQSGLARRRRSFSMTVIDANGELRHLDVSTRLIKSLSIASSEVDSYSLGPTFSPRRQFEIEGICHDVTERVAALKTAEEHAEGLRQEVERRVVRSQIELLLEAVLNIEQAEDEEDAAVNAMASIEKLGYGGMLISHLELRGGRRYIIGKSEFSAGDNWKEVAKLTLCEVDPPSDVLPLVLLRRAPRFIFDSRRDPSAETNRDLCERYKIITQYVMPLATASMQIGTLQVGMGCRSEMPQVDCMMLDAIGAHLSIAIERHRTLAQLHTAQNELTSRSRLIAYEVAAANIVHALNHSIGDYAKLLNKTLENAAVRSNKDAFEFLSLTRRRVLEWIDKLDASTVTFKREENMEPHLIEDIIKEQIETWYRKASIWHCNISATYGASGALVKARLQALTELLSCLIINGIEANARRINVITKPLQRKGRTGREEQFVEILFRDDGEGVPLDYRTRAFDLGWTTKARRGHGIGLTMSALITKEIGGFFDLQSYGKTKGDPYTEFAIILPVIMKQ